MATAAMKLFQELSLPRPYRQDHVDFMYNLLFCDVPNLFRPEPGKEWSGAIIFSDPPDFAGIEKLAMNPEAESRNRMLAFNILRWHNKPVPPKILLGVIIEVPLREGLDTLAAFDDGRVRYINKTGKLGIFEQQPDTVVEKARQVIDAAKPMVQRAGPWDRERLPPPFQPRARVTCLVSDGLYLGDGPFDSFTHDPLGGPIFLKGRELLDQIVIAVKEREAKSKI